MRLDRNLLGSCTANLATLATLVTLVTLVTFALARPAGAATLYASPTGAATAGCTTRADACSLASAAAAAVAGDTVVLMDGVYREPLQLQNSGAVSAWITFQADQCATPIIEGQGVGPDVDNQDTGVQSSTAEYVRFVGLVSRGWNSGFSNGWAGGVDAGTVSNGHWEIENCIAYSNGRTGFTFFSAPDFHLKSSISAHNGSSTVESWSSGVTLFEATGTNLVEGNVSFENTDAQKHTDGSGFIADEGSNGVSFVDNLAFGNSGSCLRLTRSSGTRFINNTCYRNSQFGSMATGPSNPGEIYFTNAGVTVQGVTFTNNVIVGTGQAPAGSQPIINQPTMGWSNNVVTTGSPAFFTAPTAINPSFVPASGDAQLTAKGVGGNGAPAADIGLDPKCIVKRTPIMVGQVARVSTWQYDVDIDYIKSIGGVAKCFNPAARAGTPDVGAYRAGAITTVTPGSCVPPTIDGTGGAPGTGGAGGTGARDGGAMGTGGGGPSDAGMSATGGAVGTGGEATTGGRSGTGGAGSGGLPVTGGASPQGSSGGAGSGGSGQRTTGGGGNGCGCAISGGTVRSASLAAALLLIAGVLIVRRRRQNKP